MILGFAPLPALASSLDVFDTGTSFPVNFLFEKEIPSLKSLEPGTIEPVLQKFMDARDRVESPAQKNLIYLGLSYIHLRQENYKKALEILSDEIDGDFILEDFRYYFLTVALRALAEESIRENDFDEAIEFLLQASKRQVTLYESFPDSPFHEDVPQHLAEIEALLGSVYFKKEDYPAAWNSYNRALAREKSNCRCKRKHLRIYSALAQTYEAGNNLKEAADIHIYILNNFSSKKAAQAAHVFLEKNLGELEQMNGDGHRLKELLNGKMQKNNFPVKSVARKDVQWPDSNDEIFDSLYHALSIGNFSEVMKFGEELLKEFPGDENVKGIFNHLNRAILLNIRNGGWRDDIDRLTDLYPVHSLNRLASRLWENGLPEAAQRIYQKVLDRYPSEALACHKALYFMGRIEEDSHRYVEAISYYEKLLRKYNGGYFTPSAQFKIPWLYRLEGELEKARTGFNNLLKYARPEKFKNPDNGFQKPDDFRPAALYWLAETERQLENYDSKVSLLKHLTEEFPMDFYAMLARIDMSLQPLEFLELEAIQISAHRQWGLGEVNRKWINRAEKLISIGFLEMGMKELSQITYEKNDPEFSYYLAELFKKAGGYQKAISLSWGISRNKHHDSISPSLAEVLFPKPYVENVKRETSQYNLSPYLVMGLMRQESAFNKKVVSSARAIGLMQLLPTTATRVARSMGTRLEESNDLKKSAVNIQLGVKYLSGLLADFEDNIVFALAAYNAGPSKVRQWMETRSDLKPLEFMESIPYKETRNYVKKVLRNYVIYKTLYGEGGIHDLQSILTVREN